MLKNFLYLTFTLFLTCGFTRNNPLDENGENYIEPSFSFDTIRSTILSEDTIRNDSGTIILNGNHPLCRFRLSTDTSNWPIWDSVGVLHCTYLEDGRHVVFISLKYQGGRSVFFDSIIFTVVTHSLIVHTPDTINIDSGTGSACRLFYMANGNDEGAAPTDNVNYQTGSSAVVKGNDGNLTKRGSSFSSWNERSNGTGNTYHEGDTIIFSTNDILLYAVWNVNTYTITYDGNGFEDTTGLFERYEFHTLISLPDNISINRPGYRLSGWNSLLNGTGRNYQPGDTLRMDTLDITLFAQWEALQSFTITYVGNSQTTGTPPSDSLSYYSGSKVIICDNTGNLEKKDFNFSGWNTKSDGRGITFIPSDSFTINERDDTLFAQWSSLPTRSISFKGNGNTAGSPPATIVVVNGTIFTIPNTSSLARTGFSFNSWNTLPDGNGQSFNPGEKVLIDSATETLYAQWSENRYTVTYSGNGNTSGTVPLVSNHTYGSQISVQPPGTIYRTGYTFYSWNTDSLGNGFDYSAGSQLSIGTKNITLYARWAPIKYRLTYQGNGNDIGKTTQTEEYLYNATCTIKHNVDLVKNGFIFLCWNSRSDGTGNNFLPDTEFTFTTSDLVLFAKWEIIRFKVTFHPNGGSATNPVFIDYGDTMTVLPSPEKKSYTFAGWFIDSLFVTPLEPHYTINSDLSLFAKWVIRDVDGNHYNEITIGKQVWLVENLKTTRFRDGTPLMLKEDSISWTDPLKAFNTPLFYWYDNNELNKNDYGALYNIGALVVNDLPPDGWHIPLETEWIELFNTCGGMDAAGGKLKETGLSHWSTPNRQATNETGFTALPGGMRDFGVFTGKVEFGVWWSTGYLGAVYMRYFAATTMSGSFSAEQGSMNLGLSVRCVRDW